MDEKEIRYLARLSHIRLTGEELARLREDLGRLLEYVDQLKSLPAKNVVPAEAALSAPGRLRHDVISPSFPVDTALANAPERAGDFFRVPAVLRSRARAKNG